MLVTILDTALPSFLVIEDDYWSADANYQEHRSFTIDRNFGSIGPLGIGSIGTVAVQVSLHPRVVSDVDGDVRHGACCVGMLVESGTDVVSCRC
jgi:hypothetical protein